MDQALVEAISLELIDIIYDMAQRRQVPAPEMLLASVGAILAVIEGAARSPLAKAAALEFLRRETVFKLERVMP